MIDRPMYVHEIMEYEDMTAKQMYEELKSKLCDKGKTYFFLDEIQEIDNWERRICCIIVPVMICGAERF